MILMLSFMEEKLEHLLYLKVQHWPVGINGRSSQRL